MSDPFVKISDVKRKNAHAADQIVDAIKVGKYQGGERLPSERELAQLMGVSRNSVREAIGSLQIVGILESRVGDGTYVSISARDKVNRGISWLHESGIDVLDIWKAKEELETILLEMAIGKATDEQLDLLGAILDDMSDAVAKGARDKYSLSNVGFHSGIAGIADHPELQLAESLLLRVTQRIYRASEVRDVDYLAEHLYRSYITHREILRVLRSRSTAEVASVMANHFREVTEFLKRVWEKP